MKDITNEQWDKRYESFFGTKDEWIINKLNNKVEYMRKKDLEDILAYIGELKGYLKHRSEMFSDIADGGVLHIQHKGQPPMNVGYSSSGRGYHNEEGSFVLVTKEEES